MIIRPFQAHIPPATLESLRARITAFRWDELPVLEEDGNPWAAGASLPFIRALCDHWLHRYDWAAQEAALNRFPQFIATIEGQDIHLLHERGSGSGDGIALVLTHGWPGSVIEFLGVIDRFAHPERFGGRAEDGIDVVVPSLPGYGFSGKPTVPVGPRRIAALWDRLLRDVLGYQGYVAQGGDWGSMVSAMLGLHHSVAQGGGCMGIHLNYLGARTDNPTPDRAELDFLARCRSFIADGRAYAETHRTTPQTLAFAMQDNPVGQAAWIIDKFHAWSDLRDGRTLESVFGLDTLLTNILLYAGTERFATATWIYRAVQHEQVRILPPGVRVGVPTGFASFPCEIRPQPPRSLVEQSYNVVRYSEFDIGGHFAALEQPQVFADDVSAFIREVRR